MKIYSSYDINEFVICCGYKGYLIKEYFQNYFLHTSDVTIDIQRNTMSVHHRHAEPWIVTLVDTGEMTNTGGRLKRVSEFLVNDDFFCFTYGDGLADIDIREQLRFHEIHGRLATITTVQPPGRYGALEIDGDHNLVKQFIEKPRGDGGMINGGFFVLSPKCIDLVTNDETIWEADPLISLVEKKQLVAFQHDGFWHPMDTLRDKNYLEKLWESGMAPWKKWS
jgi:glucose-1-phosphate cytidylyltransferase